MTDRIETIASCHACGTQMDVSAMAPFANVECPDCREHTRVKCEFGPYTLVRRHAVGGMSMVFAAHDSTLDREVAVKILSETFSANERRIAAFEEEARITASFSHPNVVRVLRTGRAFGRFYIAMEFVPGGHFEHQIRERGKIPEAEMLPLAIEVAHGLKAAHSAGLIHRDVKPGNILLDALGHAKLVDFGLALVTQGGRAQATEMWATPYYVPPESVEGYSEDFRSDIYAFGATLYHALAGKPSCDEESMATDVLRAAKKKVVPLSVADPSISAATCHIVERAMAYHPNDRFSSYDEMIANLQAVLKRLQADDSEPPITCAIRRADKKRKTRNVALAAVLVFITIAGIVVWRAHRPNPVKAVASAPTVEVVPMVEDADPSSDIARCYHEARLAVDAKNYEKAEREFILLHQNPAVKEPTRTWAGVEAVLAAFLDGRAPDACKDARKTLAHARALPSNITELDDEWIAMLDPLEQFPPLAAPTKNVSSSSASRVIAAMLAGLKNWEQGMQEPAARCFTAVISVKLPQDEQWASIYQRLAADYLSDYQVFSGPLFTVMPADRTGCETLIRQLEAAIPTLKTRGRAKYNVRAWQLDLTRQTKLSNPSNPR